MIPGRDYTYCGKLFLIAHDPSGRLRRAVGLFGRPILGNPLQRSTRVLPMLDKSKAKSTKAPGAWLTVMAIFYAPRALRTFSSRSCIWRSRRPIFPEIGGHDTYSPGGWPTLRICFSHPGHTSGCPILPRFWVGWAPTKASPVLAFVLSVPGKPAIPAKRRLAYNYRPLRHNRISPTTTRIPASPPRPRMRKARVKVHKSAP